MNMDQSSVDRIAELTGLLNQYRHEYYNLNAPTASDAGYDRLYDELLRFGPLPPLSIMKEERIWKLC